MSTHKKVKTKMRDITIVEQIFREYLGAKNIRKGQGLTIKMYHEDQNVEDAVIVVGIGDATGPYQTHYGEIGATVEGDGTIAIHADDLDVRNSKAFNSDMFSEYGQRIAKKRCAVLGAPSNLKFIKGPDGKLRARTVMSKKKIEGIAAKNRQRMQRRKVLFQ